MKDGSSFVSRRERFVADGFVVVPRVLPAALVQGLQSVMEALGASAAPPSRQMLYTHSAPKEPAAGMERLMNQWLNPHRRSDVSTAHAVEVIRAVATDLISEGPVLFQDVLMEKMDQHAVFPWHQDLPYWPVAPAEGLVVWVALDDVDALAGGVHFIRESHLAGVGPAIDLHTGAAQEGAAAAMLHPPEGEIVCPALRRGDAVAFHALTWHSSPPKQRAERRRAWATSWLPANARWNLARAPRHPLAKQVVDGAAVREWSR